MHLSDFEKMTLAHWQSGDELLYKAFSSIFQNKIEDYGVQRMKQVTFSSLLLMCIDHFDFHSLMYLPCYSLIVQIGCEKTASA